MMWETRLVERGCGVSSDILPALRDASETIGVAACPLIMTFVLTVVEPTVVLTRTLWLVASDRLYTTIRPL